MTEHDPLPTAEDVQRAGHIKALQRVRFWCHRDSQRTSLDELERAEHAEETAALDFAIAALAAQAVPAADADAVVTAMVEAHPAFCEWWDGLPETTAQSFMDRLSAALASAPAAPVSEAEPVAWQYRVVYTDGDVLVDWTTCSERQARDFAAIQHHEARPLYAHPPAAPVSEAGDFARIGELIRTQNNRITADPIFVVEEKDGKKWRFATACFTEQGCKDYLARNGHNLKEPRIFAYSGFRNDEWIKLRALLAATAKGQEPSNAE